MGGHAPRLAVRQAADVAGLRDAFGEADVAGCDKAPAAAVDGGSQRQKRLPLLFAPDFPKCL